MENIEDYVNKMLFDDTEEAANNHNVNDTALPAMPPHHAAETSTDPEAPIPVEQHAIYRDLYAAAFGVDDKDAGQLAQFSPSPVEFSSGANISVVPESFSTALGSQKIPQWDQVEQFSFPPIHYNSESANTSIMQESSSRDLGSQQQSDVQQPNLAPQKSSSLEPIPILVKSKSYIALSIHPDAGASSQHPSQGLPALGSSYTNQALDTGASSQYPSHGLPTLGSSYTNQALAQQHSSWPVQQLSPDASSSLTPEEVVRGSTYRGLSLGLSSKPGVLSIGSIWNHREVDLNAWAPASQAPQRLSSVSVSTSATQTAQQGLSGTNASASATQATSSSSAPATQATSSSSNTRKRRATWEADATAQNDRTIFRTWIRQMSADGKNQK
ncbi:uncharacterized protein [Coffea arabica]|uniref:Uncharacterized protein n=1 Tax=Coffea arabica TaxID=13443 RepID=A0A6P6UW66_COFAR